MANFPHHDLILKVTPPEKVPKFKVGDVGTYEGEHAARVIATDIQHHDAHNCIAVAYKHLVDDCEYVVILDRDGADVYEDNIDYGEIKFTMARKDYVPVIKNGVVWQSSVFATQDEAMAHKDKHSSVCAILEMTWAGADLESVRIVG